MKNTQKQFNDMDRKKPYDEFIIDKIRLNIQWLLNDIMKYSDDETISFDIDMLKENIHNYVEHEKVDGNEYYKLKLICKILYEGIN